MTKRFRTQVICIVVIVFVVRAGLAPGESPDSDSVAANKSKTPYELNQTYSRLLRNCDWHELSKIQSRSHDGLAMQAAWEHVRRSLPLERPEYEGSGLPRARRETVQRFLGFTEGRLRVRVPSWWQEKLLNARAHITVKGRAILDLGKDDLGIYVEHSFGEKDEDVLYAPGNIVIQRYANERLDVLIDDKPVAIPLERPIDWGLNVEPVGGTRYVAVLQGSLSPTSEIVAIDSDKGALLWRKKVWGEVPLSFRQGPGWFHWVEGRKKGDDIIVFGLMNDVAYVEGFSLSDGENLFRFSTNYCAVVDGNGR